MFLLVVSCFIRAVHCAPPLERETEWVMVEGEAVAVEGERGGDEGGRGKGFGPEHLREVDALTRVASDIFRWAGKRVLMMNGGEGGVYGF